MKRRTGMRVFLLAMVGLFLTPIAIQASPLGFYNITATYPQDAEIGETQLWVDVTEYGPGQVAFTFHNNGPEACSISGIYLDDGGLSALASIINGPGVLFFEGGAPPNLPGWDLVDPDFQATFFFTEDSGPPDHPAGVNPGEYLTIVFNLQTGTTISDIAGELYAGGLRIGIHVRGYESGGGASFVNNPPVCPDGDGDGYGVPASIWCAHHELDCDDSDGDVNPGATELCNGIDDNCDANTDEGFDVGLPCTVGTGICEVSGSYVCAADGLGIECDAVPGTPMVEGPAGDVTCTDGLDNDCDELIDDGDPECWACTEPADCVDDDACTIDDCVDHQCQYSAVSCVDSDACTEDSCDSLTGCQFSAVSCDDSNACTEDSCDSLTGCQHSAVSCDDSDACTEDSCDSLTGCVNSCNATDPSDLCCDNPACLGDPVCGAGTCVGSAEASTYGTPPVYGSSALAKHLAWLLIPVGAIIVLRTWRRKK